MTSPSGVEAVVSVVAVVSLTDTQQTTVSKCLVETCVLVCVYEPTSAGYARGNVIVYETSIICDR